MMNGQRELPVGIQLAFALKSREEDPLLSI
jgi:hypothetical protein